jgi:hypothetical protein
MATTIVFVALTQQSSMATSLQTFLLEALKTALATGLWLLLDPFNYYTKRALLSGTLLM